MSRGHDVYLDDILESIKSIEEYTNGMSHTEFSKNRLVEDAVIRNLAIIGEAVKKLPAEVKRSYPDVEWRKIAGLRDLLVHEYFGINVDIIWDVVANKIPQLKTSIRRIKKEF